MLFYHAIVLSFCFNCTYYIEQHAWGFTILGLFFPPRVCSWDACICRPKTCFLHTYTNFSKVVKTHFVLGVEAAVNLCAGGVEEDASVIQGKGGNV